MILIYERSGRVPDMESQYSISATKKRKRSGHKKAQKEQIKRAATEGHPIESQRKNLSSALRGFVF